MITSPSVSIAAHGESLTIDAASALVNWWSRSPPM
jgi:hypothetical protein